MININHNPKSANSVIYEWYLLIEHQEKLKHRTNTIKKLLDKNIITKNE